MAPTRLCSVADIKRAGNINVNYEYDDAGLERAIRAATTEIFSVTRREWERKQYTDRIPVPRATVRGTFRVWTEVRPIVTDPLPPRLSVSRALSGSKTPLAASTFTFVEKTGRIDVDAAVLDGYGFLFVNYFGGLTRLDEDADVFDAPADLRQACAMQAAYLYDRTVNSKVGVKQFAGKTGSTTYQQYSNGLVPEVQALVSNYIRPFTGG